MHITSAAASADRRRAPAWLGRVTVDEFVAAGSVERYFEEHWPKATVATVDSRIVGVVVLRGALVDLAWVDPAFRSHGIGSALMADAERQARRHELRLEVWKVNERAVSFYERLGFATTKEMADPDKAWPSSSCGGQSEAGRLERR